MTITNTQAKQICKKLKQEFISVKFLARGNYNDVYLLETKARKYAVRVKNSSQHNLLKQEYKVLKKLKGKFGPKVYLFDNTRKILKQDYLIEELLKGTHPKRRVDDNFCKLLAAWYKKLHSNKKLITKKERKKKNLYSKVTNYKKNIEKYKQQVSKQLWKEYAKIMQECEKLFEANKGMVSRRKYFSLTQGDPSRTNVFYNKNSVKLIDWEFAGHMYPESDIVFVKYSYDLEPKQWKLFLKGYGYKGSQKVLNLFMIYHYIAMINWKFVRLHLISKGKVDPRQTVSNKKVVISETKKELVKIKKILKHL